MATRKIVPRADNEGGIGTALKRWASAFINALTADSATIGALSGIVKAAAGVLSATALGTARQIFVMNEAGTLPEFATLPKFSAHKNGTGQSGIVTATQTKVTFTTEVYDVDSKYDAANSRWVPGVIGKAHIDANLFWDNAVDQVELQANVYKNGVLYKTGAVRTSGTSYHWCHISCDVLVDVVTDFFEIYCFQACGDNRSVHGDSAHTWFMGHMLV